MAFSPSINPYIEQARSHPAVVFETDSLWSELKSAPACLVDLGCGNGHFLSEYLKPRPTWYGIGVERRFKRVVKSAEKLGPSPAKILQQDILKFLDESPEDIFDEIWLQFPDPWPKLRHEKNRMINPWFFERLHAVLKQGGKFHFRSDCRHYWELLQMYQIRSGHFSVVKSLQGDLFADQPKTIYQMKFVTRGVPIYSLEFRKHSI